jgi:hypothetical protein
VADELVMISACSQTIIDGGCSETEEVMVSAMTNGTSKREPHVNTALAYLGTLRYDMRYLSSLFRLRWENVQFL